MLAAAHISRLRRAGALAARVRKRLLLRTPDAFTRSIRWIYSDYTVDAFYWATGAPVERKSITE